MLKWKCKGSKILWRDTGCRIIQIITPVDAYALCYEINIKDRSEYENRGGI